MTTNFPALVWIKERNILELSGFLAETVAIRITADAGAIVATFSVPNSGVLRVDMSDYVRMHADAAAGSFAVSGRRADGEASRDFAVVNFTRVGLINPASVLIPQHDDGLDTDVIIAPPLYMLKSIDGRPVQWEMRETSGEYLVEITRAGETEDVRVDDAYYEVTPADEDAQRLYVETNEAGRLIKFAEHDCRKSYVMVQWVSFTGTTRRHTFEIANENTNAENVVALQDIYNQYNERKGRVDGFTLRLENLNRYDFWYYADLITSDDVRAYINGEWVRLQVTTKSVTLPNSDEGKLSELEISVNFRKYDTL